MARPPEDLRRSAGINVFAGCFAAYLAHRVDLWVRWPLALAALAFIVYGVVLWRRSTHA